MSLSVTGLSALSSDSNLTAASVILASEHNTHRTNYRALINNLLTVAQEQQNHRSSASEPADTPDGAIWYDSTNLLFKARRSSAWTAILTAATAYTADLSTAGTETFRVGGALQVDTTQVSRTTTGVLMTFTLPGGTLARDGQYVHVTAFGTKSGAAGVYSIQPRFGTTAITTHTTVNAVADTTDWAIELWIVRTAAATQDCGSYMVLNRDDTTATTLCDFATGAKTLSGDLAIDFNLSAIAAGTVTQEFMLVEFGNF